MGFKELAVAGRAAVLAGTHEIEQPPDADGLRWGPSAIVRPDADARPQIADLASEAQGIAGPGHWVTGSPVSAHVTVRSLEPRQAGVSDHELTARYQPAVDTAAKAAGSLRFQARAVLVSPISVMLALTPVDETADRVSTALAEALGPQGWFEAARVRDIWYLNLVHFTGPIADPPALVRWVDAHDTAAGWAVTASALEVVRWEWDGHQMVPKALAGAALSG